MASVSVSSLLCEEDDACLTKKLEFDEQEEEGFVSEIEDEYVEILVQKDINFGLNTFKSSDIDNSKTATTTTTQIWWKRARLDSINWILNMRVLFGFHFRTAYLSITYFDQFLSKRSIDNGKFWAIRLLSVACLSLAAKMEECKVPLLSDYPIKEFVFENHVIQKMELLVLNTLEWKMVHITPFVFLRYFINKFFFEEDVPNLKNVLVSKAVELVSNVTKEINLIDHPPSVIAAASVLAAYDAQLSRKSVEAKLSLISLWGSLEKVANSNVRHNALHLLLDMFPFEDPDSTKEDKDILVEKQFFLLEKLLLDDCSDVRVVAVEGSCRILHLFWEIVPPSAITKIITKIFNDMSRDVCNEVRLSVVNGIIYLLGNPQSHELLKVLLPRLGHLILDSVLSVRVAVGDLLLLLRDTCTCQFNKVVGLDMLLSALANDQPLVAQKITKLLIPSYFPSKVTLEEACNRCVTLIKRSPLAGARFCEFALSEGASLKSLMQLVRVFINLAISPDKLGTEQVEGLLVATAYLCNNLASNPSYKAALKELFSGEKLKLLIAVAITGRGQSSLFNIVVTISPVDVAGLFDECIALVTNCNGLLRDVEKQAEVRSTHKLILSCNWFDDMFEAVTRILEKTALTCHIKFGTEMPKQAVYSANRKKSKSTVKISAKGKQVSSKKSPKMATSMFEDQYSIVAGLAWQIKDMLVSEDTRKALLGSHSFETAFFALKVISEASIVQCMHCEYMDTSPLEAYTALSLHMTLHNVSITGTSNHGTAMNDGLDSGGSHLETLLDQTLDHLLNCSKKLLTASDFEKPGKRPSESKQDSKISRSRGKKRRETQSDTPSSSLNDAGPAITKEKSLSNSVKMLTAVSKFVVDTFTMRLVSHNQVRCLKFASAYIHYLISNLRHHSRGELQLKDGLKETFLCLKSSCTYAAKLLNLVLTDTSEASPPPPETANLANNLLDLITSIEIYLGSGYATRLVAAVKSWLPDFILALGSEYLLNHAQGERTHPSVLDCYPSWPSIVAKIELREMSDAHLDEEGGDAVSEAEEFSTIKKLMESIILLLRGNSEVLDAVGVILLTGSAVGLERKDFRFVLGLVRFVCVKLIRQEHSLWGELQMMLASLHDIYPQIERLIEDSTITEDGREKLLRARALLEPIWMHHLYESGRDSMMGED